MSIGEQIRNQVDVRLANPETEPVIDWCQANSERNSFDRDVLTYPSTKVLAAHTNGTVYAYMPLQGTAMLESIGPNPDATPLQVAHGIMEMVRGAALLAYAAGYRELYFLASDEVTAAGAEKLGFNVVGTTERQLNEMSGEYEDVLIPFKVYRKRLE